MKTDAYLLINQQFMKFIVFTFSTWHEGLVVVGVVWAKKANFGDDPVNTVEIRDVTYR